MIEMAVRRQDHRAYALCTAANHYVGKRKDEAPAIQLPKRRFNPMPKPVVGGNLNHHIPEGVKAFQHSAVPDPAANFAADHAAHGEIPRHCRERQCAQRILPPAHLADVITAVNQNGASVHISQAFPRQTTTQYGDRSGDRRSSSIPRG